MRSLITATTLLFVLVANVGLTTGEQQQHQHSTGSSADPVPEKQKNKHECGHGKLAHHHQQNKLQTAGQHSNSIKSPLHWKHSSQQQGGHPSSNTGKREDDKRAEREESEQRRNMKLQSAATFPPSAWHKLRIHVDWTYAEKPELDVYTGQYSENRTCLYDGAEIAVGGTAQAGSYCLDSAGTVIADNNCYIKCKTEDVVTEVKLAKAGSILETLKTVTNEAVDIFGQMLSVPDRTPDTLDISDSGKQCGGQVVTPSTESAIDFYLFATLRPLHHMGETVAFALTCNVDEHTGRPFMGHMNVAPATLLNNEDLLTVLLHELSHALGFSPVMLNYFRHPNDRTKTYHNYSASQYPTGPFAGTGVIADTSSGLPNQWKIKYQDLAMPTTGVAPRLKWIGPTTIQYAQEYFGCTTIDGVEWENGGNSGSSTATHWEKRILYQESMTATQNIEKGKFTKFSTRFFQDTGFYEVNMTFGDPMTYGEGEGCNWVNDCSLWSDRYKCTKLQDDSRAGSGECNYDRTWTGYCNLLAYSSVPEAYRYIAAEPTWAGPDLLADQCGFPAPFGRNGQGIGPCTDSTNYPIVESANYRGVKTGPTSRCYKSQIADNDRTGATEAGLCFETVCTEGETAGSLTPLVRVGDAFYPCYYEDQIIDLVTPKRPGATLSGALSSTPAPTDAGVSSHSEWYYSWKKQGYIKCGLGLSHMCGSANMVQHLPWPNITHLEPSEDTTDGGQLVTVFGSNLEGCISLTIGGNTATNFTVFGGSSITVNVPATGDDETKGGLSNKDGEGPATVELYCPIQSLCPAATGCSVARLRIGFNYTENEGAFFSATNWVKDFLGTTLGKVIGGAIGCILLILLIVIVKSICEGGDDGKHDKENAKRGRARQKAAQQRAAQQGQGQGVLNAPTAMGAGAGAGAAGAGAGMAYDPTYGRGHGRQQRQQRMDEYEDDLL